MSTGNGITTITHTKTGSKARIHEFGATVLEFTTAKGREVLFVSRDAKLDGSKAVRGGIPLVFPIFGPPKDGKSTMPQHGFARNNSWTLDEVTDTESSASAKYSLDFKTVQDGKGSDNEWAKGTHDVKLCLKVEITGTEMTTTMTIQNTGSTPFPFQSLFHTYYSVDNHAALENDKCFVKGLEGYSAYDQLSKTTKVLDASPIVVRGELDSIHTPQGDKTEANLEIGVGSSDTVKLTCQGEVDGTVVPVSVVVWNPHEAKAASMGDFGNDQYNDMICVEPGLLRGDTLQPGKQATMTQTIS